MKKRIWVRKNPDDTADHQNKFFIEKVAGLAKNNHSDILGA